MVSFNAGHASVLTLSLSAETSFLHLFQELLLWSDLQKSLTCTGLPPSPARCNVRINPTVSVIALPVNFYTRLIIKRFLALVKVYYDKKSAKKRCFQRSFANFCFLICGVSSFFSHYHSLHFFFFLFFFCDVLSASGNSQVQQ